MELISFQDTLIEKLRLKNSTLKVQKKKVHLQLKQVQHNRNLLSHLTTKPTKLRVCPAKTQIRLGILPDWSVFVVR